MPDGLFAARAALHYWEEPCISGAGGSGTIFFSGCSLRCVHCQNHDIALGLSGKEITPSWLAEIFLNLQEKGAANINLVTPTHYVLDSEHQKRGRPAKTAPAAKATGFTNFKQRDYDFDRLEEQLLKSQTAPASSRPSSDT